MSPRVALEAGTQPQIGQTHRLRDIRLMPIRPQLTRTERCPAMTSPGSHRPEPPEAGETDTDAELPASLKAKRHVPSTAPYERVRSNSIAAGLIQRNRPLSDIALAADFRFHQVIGQPRDSATRTTASAGSGVAAVSCQVGAAAYSVRGISRDTNCRPSMPSASSGTATGRPNQPQKQL